MEFVESLIGNALLLELERRFWILNRETVGYFSGTGIGNEYIVYIRICTINNEKFVDIKFENILYTYIHSQNTFHFNKNTSFLVARKISKISPPLEQKRIKNNQVTCVCIPATFNPI